MTKRYWGVFILLLACSLAALAGCGGQEQAAEGRRPVPVTVVPAAPVDVDWTRSYNGTLEGIRQAEPTAKIAETIIKRRVAKGQPVKKDQVLLEFDKYGPTSQYRQAEAAYVEAKRNYEKYANLYEGGAVSEQERDYYQTQFKIAKANYESARDQVEVKSPITGTVTDLYVNVGDQPYIGQVLAVIADTDTMRLHLDIPYFDAQSVAEGMLVIIPSRLDTTITATGWVDELSESADPVTRMVSIEVLVENDERILRPGMYVTGEILLQEYEHVLTVPVEALVNRQGQEGVFVEADSTAHFRPLTLGTTVGDIVVVADGLDIGDRVVVFGQQSLLDGSPVTAQIKE